MDGRKFVPFSAPQIGEDEIREMPVRWADAAGSKVRFFEGLVNMFKDLVRIRWVHRDV